MIIVAESNFGATLDEPLGKVQALYDVKSIPVREIPVAAPIRTYSATTSAAGASPEEVFASQAPGVAPEPGEIRGRTATSPLGDPRPAARSGPLDVLPPSPDPLPVASMPEPVVAANPSAPRGRPGKGKP